MVWGCITYKGEGYACSLPSGIDSETYVTVLDDYVVPTMKCYRMKVEDSIFQHDNAPVHTARIVQSFINQSNINTMKWPAKSPDLNPMEHVWTYVRRELDKYPEEPKTLKDLWDRVQEVWANIPINYLHSLYESMPRRIVSLYKNKGRHIDY
jgi:transposase